MTNTSPDKLIFIGKNYLEHARELGDAIPEKPVIFLKPPSVLKRVQTWQSLTTLSLQAAPEDTHYEAEIVISLKKGGYQLDEAAAAACIDAVTLGLDMTRRQLQTQLKKEGHPWTCAKVFPDAAVIGPLLAVDSFPDYLQQAFTFSLNDKIRQQACGETMSFHPAALLSYVSEYFPLCAGDLIFTGTPAGVGAVKSGDKGRLAWDTSLWYDVQWMA